MHFPNASLTCHNKYALVSMLLIPCTTSCIWLKQGIIKCVINVVETIKIQFKLTLRGCYCYYKTLYSIIIYPIW